MVPKTYREGINLAMLNICIVLLKGMLGTLARPSTKLLSYLYYACHHPSLRHSPNLLAKWKFLRMINTIISIIILSSAIVFKGSNLINYHDIVLAGGQRPRQHRYHLISGISSGPMYRQAQGQHHMQKGGGDCGNRRGTKANINRNSFGSNFYCMRAWNVYMASKLFDLFETDN